MQTNLYHDESVVVPLLTKMRLPRSAMLDLASRVAGERANITKDDPPTAAGFETWRWGTRYAREDRTLKELGWVACEQDQISGIVNKESGIKLVACNTDANTGSLLRAPRNLSEKGPASCRLIGANTNQLKMGFLKEDVRPDLWYLCMWFCEDFISVEVSRPCSEASGIVSTFSDRIIVAQPGEVPGIRPAKVPQEFAEVPKPRVSRR